ncbi:hypothetical protein C8J56DRAFT_1163572 [Mycena floridula]|nr:hypothetical protein C8J56DRAFT_1163572 [Mycena floridula]
MPRRRNQVEPSHYCSMLDTWIGPPSALTTSSLMASETAQASSSTMKVSSVVYTSALRECLAINCNRTGQICQVKTGVKTFVLTDGATGKAGDL